MARRGSSCIGIRIVALLRACSARLTSYRVPTAVHKRCLLGSRIYLFGTRTEDILQLELWRRGRNSSSTTTGITTRVTPRDSARENLGRLRHLWRHVRTELCSLRLTTMARHEQKNVTCLPVSGSESSKRCMREGISDLR